MSPAVFNSEALFFMIRNTEMDSDYFVYKYSLSFCVKSSRLYYAAFPDYSKWILISGLLGVRTCWIIVCAYLWFGKVLFLVSVMTNWCSWVIIHAQNSSVFCLMSLMTPLFFWHVKQVCIHKFTFIFLQLEEDSGALSVHRSWVPIQSLKWRKDGENLERPVAVWTQLILFFQKYDMVLFRMTGLPQVKSLRREVESAREQ